MIFNLFKSKPSLKELIPEGFVDIHSHILPGIDDGAKDVNDSLEMISRMKKLGFSKIIATPHTYPGLYENTNETIKRSFERLIQSNSIDISLDYASEYFIDHFLNEKIYKNKFLTINNKFILLEFNFISPSNNIFDIIFQLQLNGYTPILAHPERYLYYKGDLLTLFKLKERGCKFQMNMLSTTDFYGREVNKMANILLKNNLVDYIASDIHNLNHIRMINNLKVKISLKYLKNIENIFTDTVINFS